MSVGRQAVKTRDKNNSLVGIHSSFATDTCTLLDQYQQQGESRQTPHSQLPPPPRRIKRKAGWYLPAWRGYELSPPRAHISCRLHAAETPRQSAVTDAQCPSCEYKSFQPS